uniref:Uncharacterized protein n=1 Tax=Anguilla anguilla TaxID=7936 RepID=A0A0E9XI53_ANGAN
MYIVKPIVILRFYFRWAKNDGSHVFCYLHVLEPDSLFPCVTQNYKCQFISVPPK